MILITGSTGRLGNELARLFPSALLPTQKELNVADFSGVRNYLRNKQEIRTIIHCAAITSAELCEKDPEKAFAVNTAGTYNLALSAAKNLPGCRFLYISTCVFDGGRGNYLEDENPSPINLYQYTKALGEKAVQFLMEDSVVVRTNFVQRGPWPHEGAFADRFANYLYVDTVAGAIREISEDGIKGTVHVSGSRKLSMYDVAKLTTPHVRKLTLTTYTGPRLPRDMSLESTRWEKYEL